MIFVTVGTHEQPFDRLVKEVDRIKEAGQVTEEIFIQTGYSTYEPQFCGHIPFISFDEMIEKILNSRIVITHGGPGSIMSVLYNNKIPIVVPRQKNYSEHVDNHQMLFAKKLESHKQIICVYDIQDLTNKILSYDKMIGDMEDVGLEKIEREKRVQEFADAMDSLCSNLLSTKKKR